MVVFAGSFGLIVVLCVFLVVLGGSWWFLVVLGDSWWFFDVLGGSLHFLVVLNVLGFSWWFFMVNLWLIVIFGDSS